MIKVFGIADFGIFSGNQSAALWATVILLGVVGSIYAIFGGLGAVAFSDTLNGIGLLIGGFIPVLGIIAVGNEPAGGGGFGAGVSYLLENNPERLTPIGKEGENIPFSTLFTGMLLITTYYWCTNQAIVQRTFASKSLAEGQKGAFCRRNETFRSLYLVLPGIKPRIYLEMLLRLMIHMAPWLIKYCQHHCCFFAAVIFGAILSSFNSSLNSGPPYLMIFIRGY